MTTYWCDPFLEATTQGTGTTDTSTRNGTYAAPFSITDLYTNSNTTITTANSQTLADGDEVRIKGLSFSTLFESKGNVYANQYGSTSTVSVLPVTGNSSFDATVSGTKSAVFAFQNSDISTYLPNHPHPLFIPARRNSSSTGLASNLNNFIYPCITLAAGYDSDSDTGIELFRVKDTYANVQNFGSNYCYAFHFTNKVKLSAGWTSETAQEGYSIFEGYNTTAYRYMYLNNNSQSKTHFDCERLVVCNAPRDSGGDNNGMYLYGNYSTARNEATDHVFPMLICSTNRTSLFYSVAYPGDTGIFPYIAGHGDSSNDETIFAFQNLSSSTGLTTTIKTTIIPGVLTFNNGNNRHDIKIGNLFSRAHNGLEDDGINKPFRHYNLGVRKINYTFLQNSIYYYFRGQNGADSILQPLANQTDSVTYETGLVKPGVAPLGSLTPSTYTFGPLSAGSVSTEKLFKSTREISANNPWFTRKLDAIGTDPIDYCSLGKLICNGNDYRTTAHNIQVSNAETRAATDVPQFRIWSAEHNDYDGSPISIIGNPYQTQTTSSTYGALVYNDVVNSTSVLVVQSPGTATYGGEVYLPLDIHVPSYNAGSDNLRVTVSAAYTDGASNNTTAILIIRAYYRDTTQSENFRYNTSSTTIAAGGDPTSTTTATCNLTNVPSSGQKDITSVIVNLGFDFPTNAVIRKFYITNVAIETY